MDQMTKALRRMSGEELEKEIAYVNQAGEHYPKGYLDTVRLEIVRRQQKGRGHHDN